MPADAGRRRLWSRRLGWLVLIWALSVAALAGVGLLMRMLMNAAGFAV